MAEKPYMAPSWTLTSLKIPELRQAARRSRVRARASKGSPPDLSGVRGFPFAILLATPSLFSSQGCERLARPKLMFVQSIVWWFEHDRPCPPHELAEQLSQLIRAAIEAAADRGTPA